MHRKCKQTWQFLHLSSIFFSTIDLYEYYMNKQSNCFKIESIFFNTFQLMKQFRQVFPTDVYLPFIRKRNGKWCSHDFFFINKCSMLFLSDNRNMKDFPRSIYFVSYSELPYDLHISRSKNISNCFSFENKLKKILQENCYWEGISDSYLNLLQLPNPRNPIYSWKSLLYDNVHTTGCFMAKWTK